jgi:hypothetical protein
MPMTCVLVIPSPFGFAQGKLREAESRNLFFNRFLHFGPLCGPTVEMTKATKIPLGSEFYAIETLF